MKKLFLLALVFLVSCSDETKPPKPTASKNGYSYYIAVCQYDGETEETCNCRGGILKKYLSDQKILLFAKATSYISQGKNADSDKILEQNPDLVDALAKLSEEGKSCDNQQIE